jgi:hypothetical protein
MKRGALLILCFLAVHLLSAQRDETLFNRAHMDFSGFWYSRTINFSFLDSDSEYFSGGNIGFEFGKSFVVGWGWQHMKDYALLPNDRSRFNLSNSGLLLAYIPAPNRVIHPYFSALIGGGRLRLDTGASDRIFSLQPTAGLELNAFRWMRLGLEGGYRLVTDANLGTISSTNVSSPFVQLQLRFGYSWGNHWW